MLYFKLLHKMQSAILSPLMVLMMLALASCVAKQGSQSVQNGSSTTPNSTAYPDPIFTTPGVFVQEGSNQSTTQFSLPLNYNDSFLVRGAALSQFLRTVPNTTRFCLAGKYTYTAGAVKFLIVSGKPKSYTDLVKKTTEFYLQVEPNNDQANQNDCLTFNLTNALFSTIVLPTTSSASFSLTQLCTNCTSSVTSAGLQLFYTNGEAVPNLNLSLLQLTVAGSTSNTTNSCVESTYCQARSYDCCLDGQCVNDGALKPGSSGAGLLSAQADVASNPTRFILYPQYYFVCANRPEDDGTEDNNDPIDPVYDAAIRLMELTQAYQCLNKVDEEFSYCTVKFTGASAKITTASPFSPADQGFLGDINFVNVNPNLNTGDYARNIVKIFYAGQVLFDAKNSIPLAPADGDWTAPANTPNNDDLATAQSVTITKALPANAQDDNLYLTFKIDGTCEKVTTGLARCTKTYIQNYTTNPLSTYYHNNTKVFNLPVYADASPTANIIVKVSGIVVPEDPTTWTKAQLPNRIVFNSTYALYTNQNIEITYYVNSGVTALTDVRAAVQTQVNNMCVCGTAGKCNLSPVYNTTTNAIVNYECVYPSSTTNTPPINQTVYVSNKNIPHRYYGSNGLNYDAGYATAPAQEGTPFSYKNNDLLKPTSLDAYTGYTGFNEIYGSISNATPSGARPAKMISVKKDQIYDMFTNSGVFSSCLTCGSDYYSSVQRIFPQSFTGMGGGYSPDNFASTRMNATGLYRSDDLLFGRACFIPATMIPWTHNASSQVSDQRRNRLAAQHFMFANGYNRDWYGFDYGSLIGSFDGVTWFSIGNSRRIKATTTKLFLAVNAYYGDLNVDSNFNVTVSETTAFSPSMPDHDSETDGAECQRSHFCSTDNDCTRQLGFDYTCQNVGTIMTNWPQSDANGTEVSGTVYKSLANILGGTNSQPKRCVYRGRGAACHDIASAAPTFNNASVTGLLACSPNTYCQSITTASRFNDRIARFASTPLSQNTASAAPTVTDIVGLGARVLGRPYDYYGSKPFPASEPGALAAFTANNLSRICIPGKNVTSAATTTALNTTNPSATIDSSDKLFGVGITLSGTAASLKYLNACPATDALGASVNYTASTLGVAGTPLDIYTTTQNISSNLLDTPLLVAQNLFSSTAGSKTTAIGYQRNSCLRAPGAACFSDMECAPSDFIASKVKAVDLVSAGIVSLAEERFWEEELVCGNPQLKYSASGVLNTTTYDVKNNKCCREMGKTMTVYTQTNTSAYEWCDNGGANIKVAGINVPTTSPGRYSRVHTAYDKLTCNVANVSSTKSFALSLEAISPMARFAQVTTQYKTLDEVNSRTCCTQNWVRSFATTNGGGHTWSASKMQVIEKEHFKELNWIPNQPGAGNPIPYECEANAYSSPTCEMRDFTQADVDLYLKFFGSLELIGIPQVAIMTENHVTKSNSTFPTNGSAPALGGEAITGTVNTTYAPIAQYLPVVIIPYDSTIDFAEPSLKKLYSAANPNALDTTSGGKQVFAANEFNCCLPTGQEIPNYTTASQCCTGYIANSGASNLRRCCLPDYTDLTVYLSRYVSSEGRGLPDSAYDPNTGYIKDPAIVETMAIQKGLCCSGETTRGVGIRKLPIPITGDVYVNDSSAWTRRFTYLDSAIDNNSDFGPIGALFDAGLRWNNHVYCIPQGTTIPSEK